MNCILIVLIAVLLFFLGAILHEADLSRNFKKYSDAKAWFFPIVEKSNKANPLDPRKPAGG